MAHARGSTGPQSAAAGTTDTANKTINQFLTGGKANIQTMEQMLRNTEKIVQQFNSYPSVKQVPLSRASDQSVPRSSPTGNQDDDPIAKRKLAEQLETIQKSFQTLQLQSIMFGTKSSCLINNTLYREGQIVNGFTIEQISPDTVTVKQDKWRFDLKMAK